MKEYILVEKIIIDRPILFLCGPYYNKKDSGDRRGLLKDKINEIYNKKFLPLIIDDFLTDENIKDENISIQLMEEICAAISLQTYIFLDTLSASAELGIFSNSAYMNELKIFIPKRNDIYNKNNVGYFVKEVALKSPEKKTSVYEYRPRVRRNALATDYIVEFYSFVDDTIPNNILQLITEDPILNSKDAHDIKLVNRNGRPENPYEICYTVEDKSLIVHTSIKLLFYVTLAIVFCEYTDFFKKEKDNFKDINIKKVDLKVKNAYANLIKSKRYINWAQIKEIKLNTVLKSEHNSKLIYHIIKFLQVFNNYSDYNRELLFTAPNGKIINQANSGKYISELFPLTDKQHTLIEHITTNSNLYYEKCLIKTGKKIRDIVKYKDNEYGKKARQLHRFILDCIGRKYKFSEYSYAYQRKKNICECVKKHLHGRGFIKYDVKKFFNSITCHKAADCMIKEFALDDKCKEQLMFIMSSCFFEEKLPLGFISSPIISDLCLKEFDNCFMEKFQNSGITYTRYADDILISSQDKISEDLYQSIHRWAFSQLFQVGLSLNEKKTKWFNFDNKHTFIRYLGINIVKTETDNVLSLGKSYIYSTAKEYIYYDKKRREDPDSDSLFYERMRIIGKIAFIKQVEGEKGLYRLKKRLFSYDRNIDLHNI